MTDQDPWILQELPHRDHGIMNHESTVAQLAISPLNRKCLLHGVEGFPVDRFNSAKSRAVRIANSIPLESEPVIRSSLNP